MVAIRMPQPKERITADEFFTLPEGINKRELVDGEVREMAPVSGEHSDTQTELAARMRPHARRHGLGKVLVELGFRLGGDPHTVRAPDVAFISHTQLSAAPLGRGFYSGHPDLAVEVVSPGDSFSEVEDKIQAYLRAGTRLVWIVDPLSRRVMVRYADGRARALGPDDVLSGEDVFPGFEVRVRDLFDLE